MFYDALITLLRADSELISYVSEYEYAVGSTVPSIFSVTAPEEVDFPYVVVTIDGSGGEEDSVVDTFNLIIDYFGWESSGVTARKAVRRIQKLLYRIHLDDDNWDTIRIFGRGVDTVERPEEDRDPRAQHYNMRFKARAGAKDRTADL